MRLRAVYRTSNTLYSFAKMVSIFTETLLNLRSLIPLLKSTGAFRRYLCLVGTFNHAMSWNFCLFEFPYFLGFATYRYAFN